MKLHKIKNRIRITALFVLLCCVLLTMPVHASILGVQTGHSEQEFAQGTVYVRNSFQSEQSGVGQQVENYFSYTPNTDVLPIVYNGSSVYGKRTLTQANNLLTGAGINSAMGMNADFFSFQTGVPMSHTIIDGTVLTKDTSWMPSLGFNADGTAFISTLAITTTLSTDTTSFPVECINKYRQPYFVYLFDQRYGDATQSPGWGINVTLGSVNGAFTLGGQMTAVVESISESDGSVPIPDGKLVLSVSADASQELKDRLYSLAVGQTVTLTTTEATGDTRWLNARYAIGCTGGTLLQNGELSYEDESAAPRSAVGIKADGTIIFYTIDGRQSGYSYGVRKETLARRLLELGCVDAVNLDGGGSTSIGGVYPETTDFTILNSPSDGTLRACANFIFLQKQNAYSGVPYKLLVYPYGDWVLSGSTVQLWASALDSAYGSAAITEPIQYAIQQDTPASGSEWWQQSAVDANGLLTVRGDGDVYVSATSGSATGSTMLHVVGTPSGMQVANEDTGAQVTQLTIKRGESINLTAKAFYESMQITAQDYSFTWEVLDGSGEIGSIDNVGFFTASNMGGATGTIRVSAGGCIYDIAVTVTDEETSTNQNLYPTINGTVGDAAFTAVVSNARADITADQVTLRVDGRETAFTFDDTANTLTYTYPDGFAGSPHRIAVIVTDGLGYSTMQHFDYGDLSALDADFTDTDGHWAEQYISYLAAHGIVQGSPDSAGRMEFLPGKGMTRAELACMLCNYLGVNVADYTDIFLPYEDAASIPFWAINQVRALHSLGVMKGQLIGDQLYFNPTTNVTRLEFAIAASRLLPSGLQTASINFADSADVPWWATENMEVIIGQGIMGGYPDGTLMPNQSVTRAEACKMMYLIF